MADPFTPRFADLVRNFTSTAGTGNLVLGAAAPGFTGFASALKPGDRFYYSVVGLEKTEESEVGRGTLQADGSIARQPISGVLTNFTTGTKTVALVAAAEWFGAIEAGRGAPVPAASRIVLAQLEPTPSALLLEPGREGLFQLRDSAALAADIALDTQQGVYVQSTGDPAKVWARISQTITPFHFGAAGDGVTNDLAALQAFNDYVFAAERDVFADWTGKFAISGQLTIGPATAGDASNRYPVGGELHLTQLTATVETLRLRHLINTLWDGRISVRGIGGASFASRTCAFGMVLENCTWTKFTGGLSAWYFWHTGIFINGSTLPNENSDQMYIATVDVRVCGSGREAAFNGAAGESLKGAWSAPTNSGVSGNSGQRTVLTIDTFPDAATETFETIPNQCIHVRINGQLYTVTNWNRTAGTIEIHPWIDPALGVSGTYEWVIGGGLVTSGQNGNICNIGDLRASSCGKGFNDGAMIGTRVGSGDFSYCGTGIMLGRSVNGVHAGSSLDGLYMEGCAEHIVVTGSIEGTHYLNINSTLDVDLAKCHYIGAHAARSTSGLLATTTIGSNSTNVMGHSVNIRGIPHFYHDHPLTNSWTTSRWFTDQKRPPRILTQRVNSQTVTLKVIGAGELNRLFGYKGGTWRYIGTGENGAPTGTFTFVPPTGGTINGGAVDASAVFSGFTGPVDFEIMHTDTSQMTWVVRVVAGQAAKAGDLASSGLTVSASDKLIGRSSAGAGATEEIACTAAGRALLDDINAGAQRTTLGLARGLSVHCAGIPGANEVIGGGIAPYAFTISQAKSACKALVAATGSATITIKNNGTQIGSFAFAAGATTATVTIASATVAEGDQITFHAPATVDATLADIDGLVRE